MAEEKLQYSVTFKTRAEGAGAQQTAAAVRDLRTETERLNALSTPEKVSYTTAAFYDLDQQATRTRNTIEEVPRSMKTMDGPTRNSATALLTFSQAAEDAQYGIRGVLNNIPGLVMSLGGGAGLAGAVSLAAVGLNLLFEKLGQVPAETAAAAMDFESMADAYVAGVTRALDKLQKARGLRMQVEDTGDNPDTAGADAETAAADARADSITALINATNTLNDLLGRQVVAQEQLAAAEARREEERQQQEARAVAAEQARAQAAKDAFTQADRKLTTELLSRAEAERAAEAERQKIESLRAQRDEYEAILKLQQPAGGLTGTVQERSQQMLDFLAQQEAARANQAGVQRSIEQAEKAWEDLTQRARDSAAAVDQAAVAANEAATELERINAATQSKIRSILEQSEARLVADTATTVTEANAALVSKMQAVVAEVEGSGTALTEIQQGGLATIKSIFEDGKVTAGELEKGAQAVQQVQIGFKGDVGKLIQLNKDVLDVMATYREDLNKLSNRVEGLKRGGR